MRKSLWRVALGLALLLTSSTSLAILDDQELGLSCFKPSDCAADVLASFQRKILENHCKLARAIHCKAVASNPKAKGKLYSCSLEEACNRNGFDSFLKQSKGCIIDNLSAYIGDWIKKIHFAENSTRQISKMTHCSRDLEMKRSMVRNFQESLPPWESFKTPEEQTLQRMDCADLQKMLNIKAEEVSRRAGELKIEKGGDSPEALVAQERRMLPIREAIQKKIREFELELECFNEEVRSEIYCEIAGNLLIPSPTKVLGAAKEVKALEKIVEITGSKKAKAALIELKAQKKAAQVRDVGALER